MYVKIGPYKNWVGPYQISNFLFGWFSEKFADQVGYYLAETWLNNFCEYLYTRRKRKITIRIDEYDCWNLDNTLSLIISESLKKFKTQMTGSGFVDNEDVPEHLHGEGIIDDHGNTDENWHKRKEYIIDEMIFAFSKKTEDEIDEKDQERVNNGLRLFAKYYHGLWD